MFGRQRALGECLQVLAGAGSMLQPEFVFTRGWSHEMRVCVTVFLTVSADKREILVNLTNLKHFSDFRNLFYLHLCRAHCQLCLMRLF